jgi:hypothetical protein
MALALAWLKSTIAAERPNVLVYDYIFLRRWL